MLHVVQNGVKLEMIDGMAVHLLNSRKNEPVGRRLINKRKSIERELCSRAFQHGTSSRAELEGDTLFSSTSYLLWKANSAVKIDEQY